MTEFKDRLLAARKAAKLSQEMVEREVGIAQSFLSELERGIKTEVSALTLHGLAKAYGTTVEYLIDGVGDDDAGAQSEMEMAVLSAFRRISPDEHGAAIKMLQGLVVTKAPTRASGKRKTA